MARKKRHKSAMAGPRKWLRLGVNLSALLVGAFAAILVLPAAAPWVTWITTIGDVPGPFLIIAGLLLTALALLAAKLLRWG